MFQQTFKKYQQLPRAVREKLSSPDILAAIGNLEAHFHQKLALVVMRVAVGDVAAKNLARVLREENGMDPAGAQELARSLITQVLQPAGIGMDGQIRQERDTSVVSLQAVTPAKTSVEQQPTASLEGLTAQEREELVKITGKAAGSQDPLVTAAPSAEAISTTPPDVALDAMIMEVGIPLDDGDRIRKLRNILKSAFKGIRDRIATRDALVRPHDAGGAALTEGEAAHLIRLLNEAQSAAAGGVRKQQYAATPAQAQKDDAWFTKPENWQLGTGNRQQEQANISAVVATEHRAIGKMPNTQGDAVHLGDSIADRKKPGSGIAAALLQKKREKKEEPKTYARSVFAPPEIAPPPPALRPQPDLQPPTPISQQEASEKYEDSSAPLGRAKAEVKSSVQEFREKTQHLVAAETLPPASFPKNIPAASPHSLPPQSAIAAVRPVFPQAPQVERRASVAPRAKIKLDDMHAVAPRKPELRGPIDELRTLTLRDFRRIDTDPRHAAKKIEQKIDLLEDEAFEKRIGGIQGFRHSPLFALYVGLGHAGLAQQKSVDDLVTKIPGEEDKLTQDEFEAIMDLNQNLRF